MSYSSPINDNYAWDSVHNWNEHVRAFNERVLLTGYGIASGVPSLLPEVVAGRTILQHCGPGDRTSNPRRASVYDLQQLAKCTNTWLKPSLSSMQTYTPAEIYAATNGHSGYTRKYRNSAGSIVTAYGDQREDDIFGPWLFSELRTSFSLMKRVRSGATLDSIGTEYWGNSMYDSFETWGEAASAAEANYGPSLGVGWPQMIYRGLRTAAGYWAEIETMTNRFYLNLNAPNPINATAKFYVHAGISQNAGDAFDANGCGVLNNAWAACSDDIGISIETEQIVSNIVGKNTIPARCGTPPLQQPTDPGVSRGFWVDDACVVFDGSNTFAFP
ncbi:MAG: hypothetical protein ACM359_18280 [Bacillota bacterium]